MTEQVDHTYVPVDITAYGDPEPVELGQCGHRDIGGNPDCGLPREAHPDEPDLTEEDR